MLRHAIQYALPQLRRSAAACAGGAAAFSNKPENAVYSGPVSSATSAKRVTLATLRRKYGAGEKLAMVTAYDYPSAVHVDQAGVDMLLVGDSVGMVVHGHDTTLPVTVEQMVFHCKAVSRGAHRAFLIGDMPFGSYEVSTQQAVGTAMRILKEGDVDAVKLEGGSDARIDAARAIVGAGVACMGHLGLTPQAVSAIGGFRPQAQAAGTAIRVLEQALKLQDAGCFGMVLECVPGPVAAAITAALEVPTIGIGAGRQCSGQVLVYHDLLGMMAHPHYTAVTPKFCKHYAKVGETVHSALVAYREEVAAGAFPSPQYDPYKITEQELEQLSEELGRRNLQGSAEAVHAYSTERGA